MSASLKASVDGTQAIIQVGGVDKVVVDSGGITSGYKAGSIPDAALAVGGLGVGQTWQNMTGLGGRASGASITNSTGKPIQVSCYAISGAGNGVNLTAVVDGVTVQFSNIGGSVANANTVYLSFIVPVGGVYTITLAGSGASITNWAELR